MKQERLIEAVELYSYALDFSPEYHSIYVDRGQAYYKLGNLDEAVSDYLLAIQANPMNARAWNMLCWFSALHGYVNEALSVCDQAVELSQGEPHVHDSRGLARALSNDISGAIEDFEVFVSSYGPSTELKQMRQEWIQSLRVGHDPFTASVLEELRNE